MVDGDACVSGPIWSKIKVWSSSTLTCIRPVPLGRAITNARVKGYRVVREEDRFHAGRTPGKSAVRNRRSKGLSHRMRRRKL